MNAIARNANIDITDPEVLNTPIKLEHPSEWKLAMKLLRFPEIIERYIRELMAHTLCDYMYEICSAYTEFYDKCRVIEKKDGEVVSVDKSRLLLCHATAQVLKQGFQLLGIRPITRM
eukprot:Nk52_evm68s32 gene=Nk52_evmTU68s32